MNFMYEGFKDSVIHFLDRLKNPFGGLFIFIWVLDHWQFIYHFLFIESDIPVYGRIEIFKDYFPGSLWDRIRFDLILPAIYTLMAIAFYHALSLLAGIIVGYFKRHWEPMISKKLGTAPVVLKSTYEDLEKALQTLEKEIDETNSKKNDLILKNEKLEEKYRLEVSTLQTSNQELNEELKKSQEQLVNNTHHSYSISLLLNHYKIALNAFAFDKKNPHEFSLIVSEWKFLYYDPTGNNFNMERFSIDNVGKYFVDEKFAYDITNIWVNHLLGILYFEKHQNGKPNFVNVIKFNNHPYQGVEFNTITGKTYQTIYSNIPINITVLSKINKSRDA